MSAIAEAFDKAEAFQFNERGAIICNSQFNIRLALSRLNVVLSHDLFADRLLISNQGRPTLLDDAAIDRLWLQIDAQFKFRPTKDFFLTVLKDAARQRPFHPVRDYLDELVWDGIPRISAWLSVYGGAEKTPYTEAVGRLVLVAAVRRVRSPGSKFDEMLVLEGPQGVGQKSTALATLCPDPAWFSDDLPLNSDSKEVIERTSGKWIVEAAELSGMGRRDVEHLKAFLSRPVDVARLAYDRATSERPRHFVVVGTTNSDAYLRDGTGNRRFWPVHVTGFDLERLKRDRDQLWAEAAAAEKAGESIRLQPSLWPSAAEKQEEKRVIDPWEDAVALRVGTQNGKLLTDEVWKIVGVDYIGHRTQEQNARLGAVMKNLGFSRVKARHGGLTRWHYVRGTKEEREAQLKLDQVEI